MSPFDTLDDAIYYAAQATYDTGAGDGNEWITLVYELPDGTFTHLPVQGGTHRARAKAKFTPPAGGVLRAVAHNHPKHKRLGWNAGQHLFSDEDVKVAKHLGVPSYMAFGDDMEVRQLDPGRRDTRGDPFPHIPEVKPAGQRIGDARALAQALRGEPTMGLPQRAANSP